MAKPRSSLTCLELTNLPPASRRERGPQRQAAQAPGDFEYRKRHVLLTQRRRTTERMPRSVVGGFHVFPARPEHHVQAVLDHVDTPAS